MMFCKFARIHIASAQEDGDALAGNADLACQDGS
ncbi:UNVERIFIED_ORG: hypothetical protein GGD59_006443 [Rhizobium esperanzae]